MRSIPALLFFLLLGCSSGAEWTAFVYPDIDDIPNADKVQNFTIGNYRTFEECQIVAIERVKHNYSSSNRQGDFQCGYKCSIREDIDGMLICKETRK